MPRPLLLLVTALFVSVSGCSASPSAPGTPTPAGSTPVAGRIAVVASTDVYGDIVEAVGGDAVSVTSIIDDPAKDPHEYTADARTQLALAKADLVVENGGGYDDFVDTMLAAAPTKPTLINVATLSGYDQQLSAGDFNEHLWYDFPTMVKLTSQLSTDLAAAVPAAAAAIHANAADFTAKLQALEQNEAAIKAKHHGDGVAITEPVPLYLLQAAGLINKTPKAFSKAIEDSTDVAPAVLKQTLDLFDSGQVKLLAYNAQTSGPQTEQVLAAAQKNQIAVVPVTETLPAKESYLTWMSDNLQAISSALNA